MYVRQTPEGKFPRSVQVPQNYSGNAFRAQEEQVPEARLDEAEIGQNEAAESPPCENDFLADSVPEKSASSLPSLGFRLDMGRRFRRQGGFLGTEELLILGLILLVASGEENDGVALLLLLLLFVE